MKEETGGFWEWVVPSAFLVCTGWAVWHAPAYILDLIPPSSESLFDQISELHQRKDVTPVCRPVRRLCRPDRLGCADPDSGHFSYRRRTVRCAHMEFQHWRPIDRIALFIGRVTMIMIISMTSVMLYEVFLRYCDGKTDPLGQ